MKIYVFLAFALCAYAADVKETENAAEPAMNKDKRQTQGEYTHLGYRIARKQEQVAPVQEPQDDDKPLSRSDNEQYRPGQVFSLNTQELLELQPERKQAPLSSNQLLQQLYRPQQEQKQNLQQIYYLEPQAARQVSYQPSSHAVIARPDYTSNGGEASVGAALSVSDTGSNANDAFNQDLLALLGQPPSRAAEEPQQQLYSQPQQVQHLQQVQASNVQNVAPQYQQVDRYITKPSKKSKLRNKAQISQPQPTPAAPQQYLIETTNVQQQQAVQQSPLYRQPQQQQRVAQALRYVHVPQTQAASQQILYERPESQGLKVVPAPKLQPLQQQQLQQQQLQQQQQQFQQLQQQQLQQQQQPRAQLNYRIVPQYQQPEASPKQYRIYEAPRQVIRPQEQRLPSQSVERPVAYLKRFPDHEKMRAVKIYEPISEGLPQQSAHIIGEQQYYLRPVYRTNEQRPRYEMPAQIKSEQSRVSESAKAPQSSIYVSKNLTPRKQARPQQVYRDQQSSVEQVNLEQHGQSLDEQRAQLPPPKNNKAYTPEEFAALVAAGYAVTPVPVSSINLQEAQSRSSVESVTMHPKRRPIVATRRHQYLPLRGDDAP